MRSLIVFLSCFLLLLGCTTPNGMRQSPPEQRLASENTARSVAICISDAWDELNKLPRVSMRENYSGYVVITNCGEGYPCQVADIFTTPSGSNTVTYTQGFGSEDFNRVAKSCQNKITSYIKVHQGAFELSFRQGSFP